MDQSPRSTESVQYLTFNLGAGEYAIAIGRVKEIIAYKTLTMIPHVPPALRGVINLRGTVVPVVDLALKFGVSSAPLTAHTCIVIVEVELDGETSVMGVIADAVNQVIDVGADEILAAPNFGTQIRLDFLRGMIGAGSKFILILNLERILSSADPQARSSDHDRSASASIEPTDSQLGSR